jgi:hypothetical protein
VKFSEVDQWLPLSNDECQVWPKNQAEEAICLTIMENAVVI